MATKKTVKTTQAKSASTKAKAAPKAAAKAKAPAKAKATKAKSDTAAPVATIARHPKARVAAHGGKLALAKSLAEMLARPDEDAGTVEGKLKTASNQQLLRLKEVTETVKQKWGSRDKLIAALGTAESKAKDKDYLAKLATLSLPHLVDLATSVERRAH